MRSRAWTIAAAAVVLLVWRGADLLLLAFGSVLEHRRYLLQVKV